MWGGVVGRGECFYWGLKGAGEGIGYRSYANIF